MMLFKKGAYIFTPLNLVSTVGDEGTLHQSVRFDVPDDKFCGAAWFPLVPSDEAFIAKRSLTVGVDSPSDHTRYGVQGVVLYDNGIAEILTLDLRKYTERKDITSPEMKQYSLAVGHRSMPIHSYTKDVFCVATSQMYSNFFYGLVISGTDPLTAYFKTLYRFGLPEIDLLRLDVNEVADYVSKDNGELIGTIYGSDGKIKDRRRWRRKSS